MLWNQKDHWILRVHRSPKQAGPVLGRVWNDDAKTGIMRQRRLIRLAVPQASAGKIGAIRRINHRGTFPVAERSPAQGRNVGYELVEAWINKINELHLKDRTLTVGSQAASNT